MRHTNALLLLLLGFASGAASGTLWSRANPERALTTIPTRTEQLEAMADEVGLDPTQRVHAHEISDRTHGEIVAITSAAAPALATIRAQVRSQMRALMNADQARRFDAYCARRDLQRAHADE
jgi:hypothetical protein